MNTLLPFDMPRAEPVQAAIASLAHQGNIEERGAVFTKTPVVDGILDLCGYRSDRDLAGLRILEPSFGDGEFLFAAIRRLLASCRRRRVPAARWAKLLAGCVTAIELHVPTFERTKSRLIDMLTAEGMGAVPARQLADAWLTQDDFLLTPIQGSFDVIVGNPPYVRQERIPGALLSVYKQRFSTLYDRADLYVLFFERCLDCLKPGGVLGFICANRWVKNKYGGPLREKIAKQFNLDVYIDMAQIDAFEHKVDAYPAITVIRRGPVTSTCVVTQAHGVELERLFAVVGSRKQSTQRPRVTTVQQVACGRDPWLVDSPEIIATVRRLEARLPTLEQAGAKVGIGVATGADKIYIGNYDELPVEDARKLKLAVSADLKPGGLQWSGKGLVNPWLPGGGLADFKDYPQFAAYLNHHAAKLKKRHTAKKSPRAWYKTIDRVYAKLTTSPKLLIPDIKGEATVVYDEGLYYPHHNLYVVTSKTWDLRALQAILKSSIALMFVATYCVRMSGGFLRFQAQYLRRIRVPQWDDLTTKQRADLVTIADATEPEKIDAVVFPLFKLSKTEASAIKKFAEGARIGKKSS